MNLFYKTALLVLCLLASPVWAGDRVALVIGNADYTYSSKLKNPVNDAQGVAKLLKKHGYDVIYKANLTDKDTMEKAVEEFRSKLDGKEMGLFYFSGFGIDNGESHLIPTQANITEPFQLSHIAMDTNYVLSAMKAAKPKFSLIILDVGRDNPFRGGSGHGWHRVQEDFHNDTLIAYSTHLGGYAEDGEGEHSPYTGQLLLQLASHPNQPFPELLNQVNVAVAEQSHFRQNPALKIWPLHGQFCLAECASQ